jgi:S-adenosylmethionine synthetase
MYKEGDILVTNCHDYPLLVCKHYGVVAIVNHKLCVFNNTPSKTNRFGGNIVCQPINEFLSERKVIRVEHSNIKTEDIIKYCLPRKKHKWTTFYNCVKFVKDLKK